MSCCHISDAGGTWLLGSQEPQRERLCTATTFLSPRRESAPWAERGGGRRGRGALGPTLCRARGPLSPAQNRVRPGRRPRSAGWLPVSHGNEGVFPGSTRVQQMCPSLPGGAHEFSLGPDLRSDRPSLGAASFRRVIRPVPAALWSRACGFAGGRGPGRALSVSSASPCPCPGTAAPPGLAGNPWCLPVALGTACRDRTTVTCLGSRRILL